MRKEDFKISWPLVGNNQITEFLEKSIVNNKVGGTYIFNGPDNLGKTTIANRFAKILLCEKNNVQLPCENCSSCQSFKKQGENLHSDFHIIKKDKDKKNISVSQVRELIRTLSMSSFLNSYKIGIIKHAESLSEEAGNALLKTLEEPKENVVVILVTSSIELLPATIVSRSQIVNFSPVKNDIIYDYLISEYNVPRSKAKNYSRLSLGRPALAVKFHEDEEFLEGYNKKAEIFKNFLNQNISERFFAIEELVGKKVTGQESVKITKRILDVWQGLARDWILLFFGHNDLTQHQFTENDKAGLQAKFKIQDLSKIIKTIKEGEECLRANVNPKLVLESIAVSI